MSILKLYQPEENPAVGQISEKDVQCFLYSLVSSLNSERQYSLFFRKNIKNTRIATKLIALI